MSPGDLESDFFVSIFVRHTSLYIISKIKKKLGWVVKVTVDSCIEYCTRDKEKINKKRIFYTNFNCPQKIKEGGGGIFYINTVTSFGFLGTRQSTTVEYRQINTQTHAQNFGPGRV